MSEPSDEPIAEGVRRALVMLEIDEHDASDDELFETFLHGNLMGCFSCQAAFTLRALLEGRELPEQPNLSEYLAIARAHRSEEVTHGTTRGSDSSAAEGRAVDAG